MPVCQPIGRYTGIHYLVNYDFILYSTPPQHALPLIACLFKHFDGAYIMGKRRGINPEQGKFCKGVIGSLNFIKQVTTGYCRVI